MIAYEVINLKSTADRIKEAMDVRNMKQADIIEKTGINKGALSSYISGKYEPKQTNTYKLAKALNVDVAWLMGLDVPMEPSSTTTAAELSSKLRKDAQAQRLLQYFYELSDINKDRIMDIMEALSEKEEG